MANVSHASLTGSSLHEPKGVASAAAGTVYIANGAGSGNWAVPSSAASYYAHFRDQKTAGTSGGASVENAWTARALNTTLVNTIAGASIAANTITLPAGTYRVYASAPFEDAGKVKLRLRNTSDNSTILVGPVTRTNGGTGCMSELRGWFTIATSKSIQLQYYANSSSSSGLGNQVGGSEVEVFAEVQFWKE